jgi:hypothetical protein
MRGTQHRHRRSVGHLLRGLGIAFSDLYEPSGEQARKLVALGLKTTWDNAIRYITDVENGLIARNTGSKVLDIGDFEIFMNGYSVVRSSVILVLFPSPHWTYWIGYKAPLGDDSTPGLYITSKRANYIAIRTGGAGYMNVVQFTEELANALLHETWDRPASTYTQAAVANTYQTGATVQEQNALLTQSLNDTNATIKYQIEQDQKAFLEQAQNQANLITFQNAYEQSQESLTQIQNQLNDIYRVQNTVDNNADLIYEAQRLEQERLRQLEVAKQTQQAIQIGTQNAQQYAQQEQQLQQKQWQQAQLDKLKQVSTNTQAGTTLQNQTATTAKTTFANTTAKPLPTTTTGKATVTSTTPTKTGTSASNVRTESSTDTPTEGGGESGDASKPFPLWVKIGLGVLGAGAVAGGAYYLTKKQGKKGKGKKDKKPKKK